MTSPQSSESPAGRWALVDVRDLIGDRPITRELHELVDVARRVDHDGAGPGSLEGATAGLHYRVLPGDLVAQHLPWLLTLYHHGFLKRSAAAMGYPLQPSTVETGTVNVNYLGMGERYELHVDSNPVTAIVFPTDAYGGGDLVLNIDAGHAVPPTLRLHPAAGTMLIFEGAKIPHQVEAVTAGLRITIPMNYYTDASPQPEAVRSYLYGSA